jgi:hypothetical protein
VTDGTRWDRGDAVRNLENHTNLCAADFDQNGITDFAVEIDFDNDIEWYQSFGTSNVPPLFVESFQLVSEVGGVKTFSIGFGSELGQSYGVYESADRMATFTKLQDVDGTGDLTEVQVSAPMDAAEYYWRVQEN